MSSETADRSLQKLLKAKGEATVIIFDRGDHYNCYGDDALLLANEVFKSDISIRKITLNLPGDVQIPYLSLGYGQYQRVIRELIMIRRYRVELYELDEGEWALKAKGTIGNTGDFDDVIGDVVSSGSTVMAISISGEGNNRVSTSFWGMDDLRITTTEFNDTAIFSQTEQCIVGMNPRECLLIDCPDLSKRKAFNLLLQRTGVMLSQYNAREKVTDEQVMQIFRTDTNLSESLKTLIKAQYSYFNMNNQPQFERKFDLVDYRTNGFMHLDGAAVKALELFSLNYFHDESGSGTLFHVLNKCKSVGGQRLLRDWIARPLCDLRLLKERQDAIASLVDCSGQRSTLRDTLLPRVPDIAQISRKLLQGKGKLQDCYRIYQLVSLLGHFEQTLRPVYEMNESAAVKELLLEPVCYALTQFDRYGDLIRSTIDEDHFNGTGAFRIKPTIDPELLKIANEMKELEKQFEKARKRTSAQLDLDPGTLKLDSNPQNGYFYRVTLKDEKNIRKSRDITIISTSKGSGVLFRDEKLTDLNNSYQELNNVYLTTQEELEKKVVETCAGYTVSLTQLSNTLAVIDVLVSLATVVAESSHLYVRPTLEPMGSKVLELRACRHAVLETTMSGQFIPNDVVLDEETRLIILTGANMGGKSTYLRSAALCVLLAQIGSFVPAESARIGIVDGIYTRVGASDQQTKGISTFMAEMLDSSSILQAATQNSFVIVDELGRGTSTFDGFGLAWAIAADILERIKCFCIYATHFHEMAELAEKDGCKSLQMTVSAENGQLSMLYEVRPGIATSSFGIKIAEMVHFPEHVVQAAAKTLELLENDLLTKLKQSSDDDLRQQLLKL